MSFLFSSSHYVCIFLTKTIPCTCRDAFTFSTAKQNSNLYLIMGLCITTYYMCMLFIYFSSGCSLLKIINTMKKDRKPVEANDGTVAEIFGQLLDSTSSFTV